MLSPSSQCSDHTSVRIESYCPLCQPSSYASLGPAPSPPLPLPPLFRRCYEAPSSFCNTSSTCLATLEQREEMKSLFIMIHSCRWSTLLRDALSTSGLGSHMYFSYALDVTTRGAVQQARSQQYNSCPNHAAAWKQLVTKEYAWNQHLAQPLIGEQVPMQLIWDITIKRKWLWLWLRLYSCYTKVCL